MIKEILRYIDLRSANDASRQTTVSRFIRVLMIGLGAFVTVLAAASAPAAQSDNFFLSAVPYRAADDVRAELESARLDKRLVQIRLTTAEIAYARLEDRIKSKYLQIDDIERQLDDLRRRQDRTFRSSLEATLHVSRQILDLLKSRRELREVEIRTAEKARALAAANGRAMELELELCLKRMEQDSVLAGPPSAHAFTTLSRVVRDLEEQCLKAQQTAVHESIGLATLEKKVIEQRLALFALQRKVLKDTP